MKNSTEYIEEEFEKWFDKDGKILKVDKTSAFISFLAGAAAYATRATEITKEEV